MERWDYDSTGALRRVYVFRLRPVDLEQTDMRYACERLRDAQLA